MRYLSLLIILIACQSAQKDVTNMSGSLVSKPTLREAGLDSIIVPEYENGALKTLKHTDDEWRTLLTEKEFYVLREEGTERAFSGDLWNNHESGIFTCAGCGLDLFESATKFESGTGWPSFFKPISADRIRENKDSSYGMTRVEVECARCGGHQGHVFEDGPPPTGLRYCINSVSLNFVKK